MAQFSHLARPYAVATFKFALEKEVLPAWKVFLETAGVIIKDPAVAFLLSRSKASSDELLSLLTSVLGDKLTKENKNFLKLLAENNRLYLLPAISELFNASYLDWEKTVPVKIVTAIEVQSEYRELLVQALNKRLSSQITPVYEVDPSILGGAVIHLGDRVVDGSLRGKLSRLLEFSLR